MIFQEIQFISHWNHFKERVKIVEFHKIFKWLKLLHYRDRNESSNSYFDRQIPEKNDPREFMRLRKFSNGLIFAYI